MARPPADDPFHRRVLTNRIFTRPGLLTVSEYEESISPDGRKACRLIGEHGRVWRTRGEDAVEWVSLTPDEWAILVGYSGAPGKSLTPRMAHGGPGSDEGALFTFKHMRLKIDVKLGRRSWELFRGDGVDPQGNALFSFNPPSEFPYMVILPYVLGQVPELLVIPESALYKLSPAAGLFVGVTLEKFDRELVVYDAHVEIPPRAGTSGATQSLPISRFLGDAVPDPRLEIPPFTLPRGHVIVRGEWPFDLLDQEGEVVSADATTDAVLCVEAGSRGKLIRQPLLVSRERYSPCPSRPWPSG